MNDVTNAAGHSQSDAEYRTIDMRRYIVALWRGRYMVAACAVAGMVLLGAAAYLVAPAYDATVRLMPPTPRADTTLSLLLPSRNPGDMYLGLISSRTVADDVIEHQHLADYFHTTKPSELRARLMRMAKISVDKDQFVTVTVRAKEPETAMRVANEFPAALYRLNHDVAEAQAVHRWQYFEGPLEQEKDKLTRAEEELKQAQQKTGMVAPDTQVRVGVTAIADLRQQIAAHQAQLAALETGSTGANPRVIELKSQIASLSGEVHRMEAQNGGTGAGPAKLPELTLEVERAEREVKYHETLFEILSKQYENARVEESYSPPVELVDKAVLPDQKSWPPRKLSALLGLLLGGFLAVLVVLGQAAELPRKIRAAIKEPSPADAHETRV